MYMKFVNFHPLMNSATLGISPKDLGKFLELVGAFDIVLVGIFFCFSEGHFGYIWEVYIF
ncbi:hypothetical protein Anas_07990 [Armadillidium nasatum]|uniref:Uncharacterized protein n=1 Tax=Armadillidium nasatum TaxID=96803 RepID=A0A5N5SQZ0_9CRUS|nr:hypothetical protein Anas_07990 [Armadillidium nasatum]